MVPNLIDIDDARIHMRADDQDSDEWFHFWIPIVSQSIVNWLKDEYRIYEWQRDASGNIVRDENGVPKPFIGVDGRPVINQLVRGAAMLELADLYTHREGEKRTYDQSTGRQVETWGYTLSPGATALLVSLRRPTIG